MTGKSIALFLHILTVAGAFTAVGAVETNLHRMRAATTIEDLRISSRLLMRWGKIMPVLIILLLVTGAWLVSLGWSWSTPWIDVAIMGLALIGINGGANLAPRIAKIVVAADAAQSFAEVPRSLVRDLVIPMGSAANVGAVCGIIFDMVVEPNMAWSLVILFAAALAGAAIAKMLSR